uniref:CACN subunit beta associated regulatory protein n=1 Tax=Cyclopterus lumpus TaxID=8103 RepID=A0A8C2W8A5_CYCLU
MFQLEQRALTWLYIMSTGNNNPSLFLLCPFPLGPPVEITIRVDDSDCLSMASAHNQETERFLSTGTMGRRVSFNEAALFDNSKKAQEKGRRLESLADTEAHILLGRPLMAIRKNAGGRYTLTEGDFHHLKNARLTHLHMPPPGLKIVTIHECDSAENSVAMTTRPVAKSTLSIFQVTALSPAFALTSLSVNPGCALPGDALNSVVDTSFSENTAALGIEMMGAWPQGSGVGEGAPHAGGGGAGSQGPVLQFFTKLRRHASLEGSSPYFKIKKWKLDSSQRASSLDTRGSPKRRQFQRQRAASESMDQDDNDAHHIDLIQYFARTRDLAYGPGHPATRLLSPPSTPPPSLGRGRGDGGAQLQPWRARDPQDPQSLYKDIWSLRATLEQYAASDQSSNNDRNSVCSDAESVCSLGGRTETGGGGGPPRASDGETGTRKLLQMDSGYASIEAPCRGPEDLRLFGSAARPSPQPPDLHRRDYSIDEKTDALFHEFLRHDPQFDQQESPLRKHRSRIHLRKQWQRHKQWSDPGVRHFQTSFDRLRAPLRRGDSVNYPLDTSYHSTLPRIVSAPDEETSEGAGSAPDAPNLCPSLASCLCSPRVDPL